MTTPLSSGASGTDIGGDGHYSFVIRPDMKLAFFRFGGRMTAKLGRRCFEAYLADPAFDPSYTMVTDARAITTIDAGFLDLMREICPLHALLKQFDKGTAAVVLAGSDTAFGMARMLAQVLETVSAIHLYVVDSEAESLALAALPCESRLSEFLPAA